jgi:hypothetical protein
MGDLVQLMARNFYGYGNWNAPYWFIGPEQGGDGNEERANAFSKLGRDGLCDCKEFHETIGEFRWHRGEPPKKPNLQPTWRRLMLLLMPSLNLDTDQPALRRYQSRDWGSHDGETCVIELGGLSAKSFRSPIDRESYRKERIEFISKKLAECTPAPKLVVMYGSGSRKAWKEISGFDFSKGNVVKPGATRFAFMNSPTAPGEWDTDWVSLGARLAEQL